MTAELRRELLARVIEGPLTIETRAILLADTCEIFGRGDAPGAAVVRDRAARLVAAVGKAGEAEAIAATRGLTGSWNFIAPINELDRLAGILGEWRPEPAVIFELPIGWSAPAPPPGVEVRVVETAEPALLGAVEGILERELSEAMGRVPMIAAMVSDQAVAFCYSYRETENLWDVSIDTLEGYRRRGLAAACILRLIEIQARRGKRPVWGALESNTASIGLAVRLGFVPCGKLAALGIE